MFHLRPDKRALQQLLRNLTALTLLVITACQSPAVPQMGATEPKGTSITSSLTPLAETLPATPIEERLAEPTAAVGTPLPSLTSTLEALATNSANDRNVKTITTTPQIIRKPLSGEFAVLANKIQSSYYPANPKIYLVKDDDVRITPVFSETLTYTYPPLSWSPDGMQLLFSSVTREDYALQLFILDIQDLAMRKLDVQVVGSANLAGPEWAPGGDQFAFEQTSSPYARINLFSLESQKAKFLVEGSQPQWINANELLYVAPYREGYKEYEWGDLHRINLNGQGKRQLTSGVPVHNVSVTSDGQRIAYTVGNGNGEPRGIYVMNSDGTEKKLWLAGDFPYAISWDLEGKSVIYSHQCQIYQVYEDGYVNLLLSRLPSDYCYTYASIRPN
jgi:hypothetical protein